MPAPRKPEGESWSPRSDGGGARRFRDFASARTRNLGGILDMQPMGSLSAYEPSWRERMGWGLAGMFDLPPERQRYIAEKAGGIFDFVPGLGEALGADDTARAAEAGDYVGAGINGAATAAGMVPVAGDLGGALLKAMFLGPMAKNADKVLLGKAKDMAEAGAKRDDIWKETGWFKGPDDKWRFEADDSQSKISEGVRKGIGPEKGTHTGKVAGVINHDALYDAYPDLRNLDATVEYGQISQPGGAYNPTTGKIAMKSDAMSSGPRSILGIGLHELQHAAQNIEGFAKGGNLENSELLDEFVTKANEQMRALVRSMDNIPHWERSRSPEYAKLKAAYDALLDEKLEKVRTFDMRDAYRRMAGEVEARNVQKRMNMTPDERRATPPWATQDVPDEQQIVRHR